MIPVVAVLGCILSVGVGLPVAVGAAGQDADAHVGAMGSAGAGGATARGNGMAGAAGMSARPAPKVTPKVGSITAASTPIAAPVAGTRQAELSIIDSLYQRRDDATARADQRRRVDALVARSPRDYEALWRAARFYFWLGDDPSQPNDLRSKMGKLGWDLAERAVQVNPQDPAGHYWAALNIGNYALGLGVVRALTMGLDGKFRDHLTEAGKLAPAYNHGGVDVAWGRYYEKLPWPKRDRKLAEEHLRRVLSAQNPANLRARVFLAETLLAEGHGDEARRLLDEVAAAVPGRYDSAEERRAKALGVGLRERLKKGL